MIILFDIKPFILKDSNFYRRAVDVRTDKEFFSQEMAKIKEEPGLTRKWWFLKKRVFV